MHGQNARRYGDRALDQVKLLWGNLSPLRRLVLGAVVLMVFAGVLAMARVATNPSMALLYGGLDSRAAGDVVAALEQRGIRYQVRGDSLFVPLVSRDELRMTLAAQGLPATGTQGYELLDGLSGFGTTSQMFDAAYWRAKEGELARTIVASPQVRAARVHIAQAAQTPFRRDLPPTASVTVTPALGGISASHARALRYLVASAVPGLDPEAVSVIDTSGNLIGAEGDATNGSVGSDRAEDLRRNVLRLIEAHVGQGRAVVELSIETETAREALRERRIDPAGRVVVSSDTEERSTQSSDSGAAGVSVASNLPDGDAAAAGRSESRNAETRERLTYEVSTLEREILRAPGEVRRITVAVLIDALDVPDPAPGAPNWRPRPDAELTVLRDLVASAIGYDADRGDVITLHSLPFSARTPEGFEAVSGGLDLRALDPMVLIQLAVFAAVVLLLGLFVLRPLLLARGDTGRTERAALASQDAPALGAPTGAATYDAGGQAVARGLPGPEDGGLEDGDVTIDTPLPDGQDAVARLRRLIESRQDESIEILRGWMEADEERA